MNPAGHAIGQVWNCTDTLPVDNCVEPDVPRGSTPANSLNGDVILVARGGPFGRETFGHGTEYITDILTTSHPNVFVFVGRDVYTTSFGGIRLKWRATCHPVNQSLTKYFCPNGTWHMTFGGGAYRHYHGGGTFTNISFSDRGGAVFADSYEKGRLAQ